MTTDELRHKARSFHNDEYEILGDFVGGKNPILVKHKPCGEIFEVKKAYYLIREGHLSCPRCGQPYVDYYYPELAKNFKNQSETHISKTSNKEVELICPSCKRIYVSKVCNYIKSGKVQCPYCYDGFSYPEKFMSNILEQLNIDFVSQFTDKWTESYRYDFMFKLNGKNYIIEMDGGYGHGFSSTPNKSIEETILIDDIKDKLASLNGYKMIRVDCNYGGKLPGRFQYIKENICKKLADILDLSLIDWGKCDKSALKSKNKEVIDIYLNETKYVSEIAQKLNMKSRTVTQYLYDAMKNNIIPTEKIIYKKHYNQRDDLISDEYSLSGRCVEVYCYEEAKFFASMKDLCNYYGYDEVSFRSNRRNNGYFKGMHFELANKLPDEFIQEPIIFDDDEYPYHILCQYTKDNKLKHIYLSPQYLPKEFKYTNIWKVIKDKRGTAYGYKWIYMSKKDEFEIMKLIKSDIGRKFYLNK